MNTEKIMIFSVLIVCYVHFFIDNTSLSGLKPRLWDTYEFRAGLF